MVIIIIYYYLDETKIKKTKVMKISRQVGKETKWTTDIKLDPSSST